MTNPAIFVCWGPITRHGGITAPPKLCFTEGTGQCCANTHHVPVFFHLFFHTALGSLWRTTQPCSPQFSSHPPGADHVPALVTISPVSVPCSAEISIFSGFQFLQNIYWHTGQHSALLFITCTAAVGKSNLKKAHLAGTRETSWWS